VDLAGDGEGRPEDRARYYEPDEFGDPDAPDDEQLGADVR
jgi:hypothetical protein